MNLARLHGWGFRIDRAALARTPARQYPPIRIAILSFLFNWPSTGGGIVHTTELTNFLARAGYDVKHFHARYQPWGIGGIEGAPPLSTEALEFDDASWNAGAIRERFRQAVASFDPDAVIIMDSWNFKPHLAEAVRDYPYFLRFQALECLCPLNNLRLLPEGPVLFEQCPRTQFATPAFCRQCLLERGDQAGALHQAEHHSQESAPTSTTSCYAKRCGKPRACLSSTA